MATTTLTLTEGNGVAFGGEPIEIEFTVLENKSSLDSFNFTYQNFAPLRYFEVEFKYTIDNINWSDYDDIANFTSLVPNEFRHYKFVFKFTRAGIDFGLILYVTDITVGFTNSTNDVSYKSIFGKDNLFSTILRGDLEVEELKENLWKKCEGFGVIPEFIERTQSYEDFWKSVGEFLALHYRLAKKITNMYNEEDVLASYLSNRGMYLCGDEDLTTLQELCSNFYKEFAKRGTTQYVEELKRLICFQECDELINFTTGYHSGWVVGVTSPLYNFYGLFPESNKLPVKTKSIDADDLALYSQDPDADEVIVSYSNFDYIGEPIDVLDFSTNNDGNYKAIGPDPNETFNFVPCDPSLRYFLSFFVKVETPQVVVSPGIQFYECDKVTKVGILSMHDNSSAELKGAGNGNYFGSDMGYFRNFKLGSWAWFFGIVNPEGTTIDVNDKLSLGVGHNLKFSNGSTAKWMYPIVRIGQDDPGTTMASVYGIKLGLLNSDFVINYVGLTNFIFMQLKNNTTLRTRELTRIVDRFLIPARTKSKIKTI